MKRGILLLIIIILSFAWSFILISACTWLICFAIGVTFTWLKALIVWVMVELLILPFIFYFKE
jgi:hypothetical protein